MKSPVKEVDVNWSDNQTLFYSIERKSDRDCSGDGQTQNTQRVQSSGLPVQAAPNFTKYFVVKHFRLPATKERFDEWNLAKTDKNIDAGNMFVETGCYISFPEKVPDYPRAKQFPNIPKTLTTPLKVPRTTSQAVEGLVVDPSNICTWSSKLLLLIMISVRRANDNNMSILD